LLFLLCCCTSKDEVLVWIGKQELMREDYLAQLQNRYPENTTFKYVADSVKLKVLDRLINNKLKVAAALDGNLQNNTDLIRALKLYEKKELKDKYIEKKIWDKFITPKEIDFYISKLKDQIRISQLIIGYSSARYYARRSRTDAMKVAEKIYKMSESGIRFSALIKMYSDDQAAPMNNGDLGYRNWDQYPDVVRDTIWNMAVGEISKPVETASGIYIVRVDAKKRVPKYKSKKNEANILKAKSFYSQVYSDTIRTMINEENTRLIDRYGYRLLRININNLAALITQKLNEKNAQLASFSSADREMALAEWQGGKISFNTLLDKYSKNYDTIIRKFAQMTFLQREVEKMGSDELMVFAAQEAGFTCEQKMQLYMEKELVTLVDKQMVRNKIEFTDDNLKRYYQDNPAQFTIPDRIELWAINVSSQKEADQVIKQANKGQDFENLASRFAKNTRLRQRKGYLGYVAEDAFGSLSREAFNYKGASKIIGPVTYRKNLYVLKTGRFRESYVAAYEDVRDKTYRLYEKSQYTILHQRLIGDLKSKYEVKLNKKVYYEI
jgi:parvulin-like peptidyl-prolyl isomerase